MTSRVALAIEAGDFQFSVPFPYISNTHVTVAYNRRIKRQGLDYYWRDSANIEFYHPPGKGVLEIIRQTPVSKALVAFHNGSVLTQDELNMAFLQALYATEETRDYYEALVNGALDGLVLQSGAPEAGPVIDKVIEQILSSEELKELQARIVDIDTNANTILSTQIDLGSLQSIIDALTAPDGGVATLIQQEANARVEGDTGIVETIDLIGAKSADGTGFIANLGTLKVSPDESLGDRLTAMQVKTGENTAAIAQEATTRTDENSAMATRVDNVVASLTDPDGPVQALITQEAKARADEDGALGTRLDGILTTVGENKALFDQQVTVQAGKDSALASDISTLQTRVGKNEASIQQTASVANGLSAQYMLKTDVNGYVAGFGLWNNGATSTFNILADHFAIVSPGYPGIVPFAVDANGVYMNNAYIRNLTVDKITGGAISAEWALNSTNGRIVLDTGAFMKVLGVGFGANRDLIEWFGPKMAISSCTKGNAITYVGMDGSAYFGGTLSAGVLYNAASSTSIAGDTYAVVGPFASNGRAKTIVCSYTRSRHVVNQRVPNTGFNGGGQNSALVSLYRNLNGAGDVLVAQQYVYGNWSISNVSDGASDAWGSINGSFTFVDTAGASNNYVYTVRLSQLSMSTVGGAITSESTTAKLTVVSTEQ
ncbi:phage tail fiber protein [Stenotrophomonas oahuensis]|uniref:Phage tail fiber protein n=1 Tax=Stenotrophomonas oahuensis TaxID=3003271 RepID=A0ABY9YP69_9GAMM|nr:phage tail fiber protein [Stenotrophomonas sp. A5586]WNH52425.1 phage tail fiber protein [Stenotrophomonas sp. A5586]